VARRRLLFAVLLAACLLVAGIAVASAVRTGDPAEHGAAGARDVLPAAEAEGTTMLITRSLDGSGTQTRGQVAIAPLGPAPGRRTVAPLRCDRVYFAAGRGVCLARGSSFAAGYEVRVFGADLRVGRELPVEGVPSRARVSPDGRYGSVTMFVTGHSYADAGAFSTQTTLLDMATGAKIADLEEFSVTRGQRQVTAIDVNYWGVTFARDSDRFYATMATGGKTYLIEGSVRRRTARVLHENVECPSLSPDGTRIAYKRRTHSDATPWRLSVLDLATMRETPLAETRSVDDQAEWLDDGHVLYRIDDGVNVVAADGTGKPRVFMAGADSPAVVRG
jgi:WD40-like Beta Propeller Repeat